MSSHGPDNLIAVVSGKGGVGKTNVVANLAVAAAGLGAKVLVVDGDLGLANLDLVLGLVGSQSAADVIAGSCAFEDALLQGPRGIHVLPAASARADLTGLNPADLAALLVPIFRTAADYDLMLVDLAAGLAGSVVSLAAACDRAILVTTAEPTALADAYATLKVLGEQAPKLTVGVLVNACRVGEARASHARLERLARRFLETVPPYLGYLPRDRRLAQAVRRQQAVVEAFPLAPSSKQFVRLAAELLHDVRRHAEQSPQPVGRRS